VLGKVPGSADQYADVQRHPENQPVPGVQVLRVEGGLFFANADAVRNVVRRHASEPGTTAVILDAEAIPAVDVTAAKMLGELAADLERDGVGLYVARDIGQVRDVLDAAGEAEALARVFPTVQAAVDAALAQTSAVAHESQSDQENTP
jgi:MFS superfamily sulfate permease-like transporter